MDRDLLVGTLMGALAAPAHKAEPAGLQGFTLRLGDSQHFGKYRRGGRARPVLVAVRGVSKRRSDALS